MHHCCLVLLFPSKKNIQKICSLLFSVKRLFCYCLIWNGNKLIGQTCSLSVRLPDFFDWRLKIAVSFWILTVFEGILRCIDWARGHWRPRREIRGSPLVPSYLRSCPPSEGKQPDRITQILHAARSKAGSVGGISSPFLHTCAPVSRQSEGNLSLPPLIFDPPHPLSLAPPLFFYWPHKSAGKKKSRQATRWNFIGQDEALKTHLCWGGGGRTTFPTLLFKKQGVVEGGGAGIIET